MLKADMQMGRAYSDTEEIAGLARKVSSHEREIQTDGKGTHPRLLNAATCRRNRLPYARFLSAFTKNFSQTEF